MRVGPPPPLPSLAGFAARSGRRRLSTLVGPHPHELSLVGFASATPPAPHHAKNACWGPRSPADRAGGPGSSRRPQALRVGGRSQRLRPVEDHLSDPWLKYGFEQRTLAPS